MRLGLISTRRKHASGSSARWALTHRLAMLAGRYKRRLGTIGSIRCATISPRWFGIACRA